MGRVLLYCATVFLSAFLLFQVQPVVGKYILPWFGSTPGVWTTCMLFFQMLLLGGYAYAHFIVSRLEPRRQAWVHGVLLALALLALPITPSADLVPEGADAPVGAILLVLAASVGVPYLLLSATGPLLQGWFARLHPGRSPYWLYALSNVGSLLALVTYPIWVERAWGLDQQTLYWSLGFGAFALLCGGCAWTLRAGNIRPADGHAAAPADDAATEGEDEARPTTGVVLLWFLLAATASALLLATTNQMCLDIAVIPFLWILPLGLYLLSFIFAFGHDFWYARPLFLVLLPFVLWRAYLLLDAGVDADIGGQVVGYGLALFIACMCCHGELSRSKPAPRHLTFFFLIVSMGGAAGGLLVALVAHNVFNDFHEFPILLCASFVVVLIAAMRNIAAETKEPVSGLRTGFRLLGAGLIVTAVVIVTTHMIDPLTWSDGESKRTSKLAADWFENIAGWLWLPAVLVPLIAEQRRWSKGVSFGAWWGSLRLNALVAGGILGGVGAIAMFGACTWSMRAPTATVIAQGRNFYGTIAIKEYYKNSSNWDWTLRHGRIMHGFQYKLKPGWPTSYYGPESGAGLAIRFHPERQNPDRAFRIGVVGLGGGTLAAYANASVDPTVSYLDRDNYVQGRRRDPPDVVRYYEINPMVVDWAWEHFTYLSDARGRGADVDVFLGDARLVMERQLARDEGQKFDVLAIDAFSSDAIPIHLLTKESFEIYFGHMAEGGALAIHVTNRFIELKPVVRRLAQEFGKRAVHIENVGDDDLGVDSSDWMVITDNEGLLRELELAELEPDERTFAGRTADVVWTDDYSSVWSFVEYEFDEEAYDEYGELQPRWLRHAVKMVGLEEQVLPLWMEWFPPAVDEEDDESDD